MEFIMSHDERLTLTEKQTAIRLAGHVQGAKAVGFLAMRMNSLLAGRLQPELTLDVLEACRARTEMDFKSKLATTILNRLATIARKVSAHFAAGIQLLAVKCSARMPMHSASAVMRLWRRLPGRTGSGWHRGAGYS